MEHVDRADAIAALSTQNGQHEQAHRKDPVDPRRRLTYRLMIGKPWCRSSMTLIATFSIHGLPFALGDLLISGNERSDSTPFVPSVGPVTNVFPLGSGYSIIGLQQKVNILSEDCVIAWSGSVVHARVAIKELRQLANTGQLDRIALDKYIADHRCDIEHNIELLGWVRERNQIVSFSYPAIEASRAGPFGHLRASGSGTSRFHSLLSNLPATPSRVGETTKPSDRAFASVAYAMCCLIEQELITQGTLTEYFGGWWELVFHDGKKFAKLSDVTFVFWEVESNASVLQLKFPKHVVKQDYVGDVLRMHLARQNDDHSYSHECYFATSIDSKTSDEEKRKLQNKPLSSMNSNWICHCISCRIGDKIYSFVRIEKIDNGSHPSVLFYNESDRLTAVVRHEFTQAALSALEQEMHRHGET